MFYAKDSTDLPVDPQELKNLLGGKGAGLITMAKSGLPIPNFVVFPTTLWEQYTKSPKTVMKSIKGHLPEIKERLAFQPGHPSLMSVRSGARVSCPGMMDTILNVGLDDDSYEFWQKTLGTQCVIDSRKRLVQMYGSVVKGIAKHMLEGHEYIEVMSAYERDTGEQFPTADEQLLNSIEAVFKSWDNERAKVYRKLNNIPESWGTAVVIQSMVFGNLNDRSGTGVLFTRNPDTGADEVTGEFLVNAQGEDVVAGIRTPLPLGEIGPKLGVAIGAELLEVVEKLETLNRDVQDVEFTIQDGKLFILQTRSAKRSAKAAVKIALDMLTSKMITPEEAKARVSVKEIDLAHMPVIDPSFKDKPMVSGISACSGVVSGRPVFSSAEAVLCSKNGEAVILVTKETTPDDIAGMVAAVGVLTLEGGSTSHAAVVARSMNKPCVVGIGVEHMGVLKTSGTLSFCGATGRVWNKKVPVVPGDTASVKAMRDLKIGESVVVVAAPPEIDTPVVALDLGRLLMLSIDSITEIAVKTGQRCDKLLLMINDTLPQEMLDYYHIFMDDDEIAHRKKHLRMWAEQQQYAYSVVGWPSPKAKYNCVVASDLKSLVLADKSALVLGTLPDGFTPEGQAVKKVLSWLKNEGVTMGTMGGWSVLGNN